MKDVHQWVSENRKTIAYVAIALMFYSFANACMQAFGQTAWLGVAGGAVLFAVIGHRLASNQTLTAWRQTNYQLTLRDNAKLRLRIVALKLQHAVVKYRKAYVQAKIDRIENEQTAEVKDTVVQKPSVQKPPSRHKDTTTPSGKARTRKLGHKASEQAAQELSAQDLQKMFEAPSYEK